MFTTLRRQAGTGLAVLIVFTVLCGLVYPLLVWGVSRIPGLSATAEGQGPVPVVAVDPVAADAAADPYFHTRPSVASLPASGGSNKAQDSVDLLTVVSQRRALIAQREDVAPAAVPADAVAASASGLDPDISPGYAALQTVRVVRVTGLSENRVQQLVADATDGRILGFLGEPTVNVPELNAAIAAATTSRQE
ncbi:potassium-transporting ATPase KdpC subunit [Pseudonocardia sulfidoxydans NBRC 16205]|uniref:Potassium-transporting ATPase KdpC subunit n=1 Tax=Pseudonocardia sulfidoxydans NBRC 16205 TaxID=1223511 RepID=A0A511DHF8_9PSEU|nr:potassium-transporting ATPase subunit C [Pseudonocardia sulfidoxydans]GEL24229.1 potassium-transporting ATPase KdpC subunit [Pseudonocardia sulfidoxydans NBRC 16205]